jgi:hypothetical protein
VTLNYRDIRQALTEFDRILSKSQTALWDDDPSAEKTAILAPRSTDACATGSTT